MNPTAAILEPAVRDLLVEESVRQAVETNDAFFRRLEEERKAGEARKDDRRAALFRDVTRLIAA